MKRSVVALSLLALAVTGCSNGTSQSGDSQPDNQVEQPPLPGETGFSTQGPDPSTGPDASTSASPAS